MWTFVLFGTVCSLNNTALNQIWTTVGSTVTLKCSYNGDVNWYFKYYIPLTVSCKIQPTFYGKIMLSEKCETEGKNDLLIVNVSTVDEGEYSCEYFTRNYTLFMIEKVKMKIKGQPMFLKKKGSNIIHGIEGKNLTLECMLKSGSTEQLLIKSEDYLEAAGGPEILNLTLIPSRTDHLKKYMCIANSSEFDNPLVDFAMLNIILKPRFFGKDSSNIIYGTEGKNLTLSCGVESGSSVKQLLIEMGGSIRAAGGPENLNFTLTPSRADHLSKYICIANSSEFDSLLVDYATMFISHIPDEPTNITAETCLKNVSISWQPGNSGYLHQVFYIQYKEEGAKQWNIIGPINQTESDDMTYQLSNLPCNRFQDIKVFSENDVGRSAYSAVLRIAASSDYDIQPGVMSSEIRVKYWFLLGSISVGLILICIMTHIWRGHRTKTTVRVNHAPEQEANYDEIGSVYYQRVSVVPAPLPPIRNNAMMVSSTIETDNGNIVEDNFQNNESKRAQNTSYIIGHSFQRHSRETVNSRNSHSSTTDKSTEAESSEHRIAGLVGRDIQYTSIIQNIHENHAYSVLRVDNRVENNNG